LVGGYANGRRAEEGSRIVRVIEFLYFNGRPAAAGPHVYRRGFTSPRTFGRSQLRPVAVALRWLTGCLGPQPRDQRTALGSRGRHAAQVPLSLPGRQLGEPR